MGILSQDYGISKYYVRALYIHTSLFVAHLKSKISLSQVIHSAFVSNMY